jgi:PTH2 family peptidyl-tRNA hydrolase
VKQVIVVDRSLALPVGKLAAQVAHASVGAFLAAPEEARAEWLREGMPKIVLRVEGPSRLVELEEGARREGLPSCLVEDAGRTVLAPGTVTCLGVGPARDEDIDALTGALPLL